jgi:hypothetical protein
MSRLSHLHGEIKLRKTIALAALFFLFLTLSTSTAYAANAHYVRLWITDAFGNPKIKFEVGETVYIRWKSDRTVDICVFQPGGGIVLNLPGQPKEGCVTFIPNKCGFYLIICGRNWCFIAIGAIFVVPDLPFGAVTATALSLSALGLMWLRRVRKELP